MKEHKKKTVHEICNYLGQDLDHPMCKELIQHLKECPDCQFYLETVKLTVNLFGKPIHQNRYRKTQKKLLTSLNLKK